MMSSDPSLLRRKTTHLSDFLTAEGVLAFYHNNSDKAKAAIQEAMIEGRGSAEDIYGMCDQAGSNRFHL